MKTINWGLLSTARINRSVIPPIQASDRNRLVAVASRNLDSARAFADKWSIPEALGSYEALLSSPHIDAVYIPLPNHLHTPWAIKAMQAGKHVLCEKPLALAVQEVDALAQTARKTGCVIAEAFMYRHHPRTLKLRAMIQDGAIGTLQLIKGAFTFTLSATNNIRLNPEMGGGSLWDVGCYPLSFARYIVGSNPLEVYGQQVQGETGIDLSFSGLLKFPENVLCQFDSGFRTPYRVEMEFIGSEGIIRVPNAYKPGEQGLFTLIRNDEEELISVPGPALYSGEIEDLADAILLGKQPEISLSESRDNIETINALQTSVAEGRPITLH